MGKMQNMQITLHNLNKNTKQMSKMSLPKWMDLNTVERHKLLGEIIDAMIYSGEAVINAQELIETWRLKGYIKSVILPETEEETCPECDGRGCKDCTFLKPEEL